MLTAIFIQGSPLSVVVMAGKLPGRGDLEDSIKHGLHQIGRAAAEGVGQGNFKTANSDQFFGDFGHGPRLGGAGVRAGNRAGDIAAHRDSVIFGGGGESRTRARASAIEALVFR